MQDYLRRSAETMAAFAENEACAQHMEEIALAVCAALRDSGKLLVAGNGGSAADAQHIAGEFTSRLMYDRRPLAGIALTTDTSGLTAIGNDYGFEHVFSRQIAALGRPGDVFLGITTSGRSPNIVHALREARRGGLTTVVFLGGNGVDLEDADIALRVPSDWTPLVQQMHIAAAHIVCALVERALCPREG
ncbi:D-sedoheptulose 7-phosphate isomerase [Gluconobacter morbifer]|uniref:Phosphoheptose isomerase n=1 Tax=Gluconobacter morbifer G707 TaxID=1088869 RepID=G6XMJ9_9PROT|nr:D-sedoheptulose 7-phosphate isomerase [Gluconobacter morbifer]EHH67097.1 phosphoheptose isomerase [Gluconobacter morbifer G707]